MRSMNAINPHKMISKTSFIRGQSCLKYIFLDRFHPGLKVSAKAQLQRKKSKHDVVLLARQLFPVGIEAYTEEGEIQEAVQTTTLLIAKNDAPVYDGVFIVNELLASVDILIPGNEGWSLYSVKSAISISEDDIDNLAFQYHVLTNAGILLSDLFIVYLNGEYVRYGELDVKQLFIIVSMLDLVLSKQKEVQLNIERFNEILQGDTAPDMDIGIQCLKPHKCDFKDHCWQFLPQDSVFSISRLRKAQKFELYRQGLLKMKDIPKTYPLNQKQWIQVESHINDSIHIDKKLVRSFLGSMRYPLFFMDYETIMPAIPCYENTWAYQQILFQFSIHILQEIHSEPEHFEFLGEGGKDPRPEFIEQLLKVIEGDTDIIVFNSTFEISRLKELAWYFPDYSEDIESIIFRIKDLMVPFQDRYFYHPQLNGSYSLKTIVPILIPELNYNDLEISDRESAMSSYEHLIRERDHEKIIQTRHALLKYCERDTLSLVRIMQKLYELAYG